MIGPKSFADPIMNIITLVDILLISLMSWSSSRMQDPDSGSCADLRNLSVHICWAIGSR